MLKRSGFAIAIVLMALAAPAFGDLYTFNIDQSKSTFDFFNGSYVTRMAGTFSLNLDGSSPTWAGTAELESVDAVSLDLLQIIIYNIQAGNLKLLDFDEGDNDSGTLTYDSGTHIASGTVNTEVWVDYLIDPDDASSGWEGPFDWTVEVSDDDYIGSAEPGWTPEARLTMSGSIGSDIGPIPFNVELVGAAAPIPEPATMTLLLGGMLMVLPIAWRRRRR